MKKIIIFVLVVICFTGCRFLGETNGKTEDKTESKKEDTLQKEQWTEENLQVTEKSSEVKAEEKSNAVDEMDEPVIKEIDLSQYFQDIPGCMVLYNPQNQEYSIYNAVLADTRRSPCSSFKIISTLLGLEYGAITKENSVRHWSGEIFSNPDWNKDMNYEEAFRISCVWYYRQLIDELGKDILQKELVKLKYGNQDISAWEGNTSGNDNNTALNGFWLESSLKISPKEQVEVLSQIFETDLGYKEENIQLLKEVMEVNQDRWEGKIYGKTGTGKQDGKIVDAWFVGMMEHEDKKVYFTVYLPESLQEGITGLTAKEIAIDIAAEYFPFEDE
jgi:bla regulator protein BlaR1